MQLQNGAQVEMAVPGSGPQLDVHILGEPEEQPAGLNTVQKGIPKTWDGRLAYVISNVGSPPVVALATLVLTASTLSNPRAWTWMGIYVFLSILIPLLYLVRLVRRKQISDLDVQLREQRSRPLIFTLGCAGLAWLVLALGRAPTHIVAVAGAVWLQTAAIFAITLRWKISVHCAAAAGAATVAWSLAGTSLPLLVGVPLIAWSRIRLRRHTLGQTIAGTLLGITVFLVAFSLLRGR